MKRRRILFVCYPDTNSPIGGVKQIYRQAELLQQNGWDALVLQQEPGFRADWFESKARVIDLKSYLDSPPTADHDLIVLPETWLKNVPSYLVGIPKVIFNQNAFYSFGLESNCDPSTLELYQHPDIKGVLTVSEDSRRLLVEGFGIDKNHCTALINGIDANLFYVPNQKAPHIVFIGRKQADHARKVALMARGRPAFSNYNFRELPRMQHEEIAKELREALMFLSCGHPEGFGLPLAEAIACGCLVVGYHGLGGRDFALPHMKVVEFGDLMGFLDGIEAELKRFEANPNAVIQERFQASKIIQEMYSVEEERLSCLNAWQSLTI
ncbi:hypothetical protein PMIT1313_00540 [Prochlorococcus marinus str. MIT 1313]|uniref:glycosyltransferase n=1 Tax=Prochlorococcus TaxID=1218 RepID=UPI0007B3C4B7|nr:glycosyltransferase [Prochlorococcus marinus]KZR70231.1 hypothetical protein PMIT1313_00540 [Prochlorococcus marinus str. MIT 1313]KZR70703.1 hypothetical protein PMIT1318_01843 [Prochlorococcus marinus str. MIT 1318]